MPPPFLVVVLGTAKRVSHRRVPWVSLIASHHDSGEQATDQQVREATQD